MIHPRLKLVHAWALAAVAAFFTLTCALPAQETPKASTSAAPAQGTPAGKRFEADIVAFEKADATNPPPKNGILFIGSSSIRFWKTLAQDFPNKPVFNRGFGGSDLIDSVNYADRIIIPYHPRMIVLYAGTNDIARGKSPQQVFGDFKLFVSTVRAKLPEVRLAYIANATNPARWSMVEQVRETNKLIADYIKTVPNCVFIDVFPQMLGPDGQPKPDIYSKDRLHMNEKGYALWTGIVAPYLE